MHANLPAPVQGVHLQKEAVGCLQGPPNPRDVLYVITLRSRLTQSWSNTKIHAGTNIEVIFLSNIYLWGSQAILLLTFAGIVESVKWAFTSLPPTWESAAIATTVIFVAGAPVMLAGLSLSGYSNAFLLALLVWRAFGGQGTLIVSLYFILVSTLLYSVTMCRRLIYASWNDSERRKGLLLTFCNFQLRLECLQVCCRCRIVGIRLLFILEHP